MKIIFVNLLVLSILLGPCHTDKASGNAGGTHLSPDVQPVVNGNWYRPAISVTWQWQLEGNITTSYEAEIYDIDLFDTPLTTIQELHSRGKKVICYFSAGSYEDFREDRNRFLPEEVGNPLENWENERWLDIRSTNVHSIMKDRLALAKKKGCDGVEPDNVDGFSNDSGFDLTASDQLAFNRFLANEAHKMGLSVGLKNDLEQLVDLVDYYDFSVNEQCFKYNECNILEHFIKKGKPVLNAEYMNEHATDETERDTLCRESINLRFSTLILPRKLNDAFRYSCL